MSAARETLTPFLELARSLSKGNAKGWGTGRLNTKPPPLALLAMGVNVADRSCREPTPKSLRRVGRRRNVCDSR
jgi:hypothetical protein